MIIQQQQEFTANMIRPFKPLNCILVLLPLYCAVSTSEKCFDPGSTVEYVQSCPENLQAWNQAAKRKNCSVYQPTCQHQEKPVYHCVTNPWNNATLEVCAFQQSIVGYYCPEFNLKGRIIQENYHVSCKEASDACPFYYFSTDVYKYPSCFQINEGKRKAITYGVITNNPITSSESLLTTRKYQSKDDSMTTHTVNSFVWEITDVIKNNSITTKPTGNTIKHSQVTVLLSVILPVLGLVSVTYFICCCYHNKRGMKIRNRYSCCCGTCWECNKCETLKIRYKKDNKDYPECIKIYVDPT